MRRLFKLALIVCFVPASLHTPIGFISLADLVVGLLIVAVAVGGMQQRELKARNPKALMACCICYAVFALSQVRAHALETSLFVKYAEFLLLLPLATSCSKIRSDTLSEFELAQTCAIAASLLAVAVFLSLLTGGQGQQFSLSVFGNPINKNALGEILLYGVAGSAYIALRGKGALGWTCCGLLLVTTLLVEARSAFMIASLSVAVIWAIERNAVRVLLNGTLFAVLAGVALWGASATPLGTYYIERYVSATSLDSSTVTSSTSRLLLWDFAVARIQERPWLGWGHGTFSYVGSVAWLDGMYEPHNAFLQLLHGGGIIGFVSFVIALSFLCRRAVGHNFLLIAMISYVLNTMVGIIFSRLMGHLFFLLASYSAFCLPPSSRAKPRRFHQPFGFPLSAPPLATRPQRRLRSFE